MVANPEQDFVLKTVESRDVHFVRFWFTDVLGNMKSFAVVPGELESAFEEGIGFDGSAIEGLTRVFESDMLLAPDPSTFQMLPWRDGDNGVARMFCDVLTPDGEPARTDPRSVLERQLARVAEAGFTCYIHPEIEFYLVNRDADGRIRPTDDAGLLRPRARGTAHALPPPRHPHARADGDLGAVLPPRGWPGPERDRPALRRRPVDGGTTS